MRYEQHGIRRSQPGKYHSDTKLKLGSSDMPGQDGASKQKQISEHKVTKEARLQLPLLLCRRVDMVPKGLVSSCYTWFSYLKSVS